MNTKSYNKLIASSSILILLVLVGSVYCQSDCRSSWIPGYSDEGLAGTDDPSIVGIRYFPDLSYEDCEAECNKLEPCVWFVWRNVTTPGLSSAYQSKHGCILKGLRHVEKALNIHLTGDLWPVASDDKRWKFCNMGLDYQCRNAYDCLACDGVKRCIWWSENHVGRPKNCEIWGDLFDTCQGDHWTTTTTTTVKPEPIPNPTIRPTVKPEPIPNPTIRPTVKPEPIPNPTIKPTVKPEPIPNPTIKPTVKPEPIPNPTIKPTVKPEPIPNPTIKPTVKPEPIPNPTIKPTVKPEPTPNPTIKPTVKPEPVPNPTIPKTSTSDFWPPVPPQTRKSTTTQYWPAPKPQIASTTSVSKSSSGAAVIAGASGGIAAAAGAAALGYKAFMARNAASGFESSFGQEVDMADSPVDLEQTVPVVPEMYG